MLIWSSYSACINLKLHYYRERERERERDVNESQSKNNVTENRETSCQFSRNNSSRRSKYLGSLSQSKILSPLENS